MYVTVCNKGLFHVFICLNNPAIVFVHWPVPSFESGEELANNNVLHPQTAHESPGYGYHFVDNFLCMLLT